MFDEVFEVVCGALVAGGIGYCLAEDNNSNSVAYDVKKMDHNDYHGRRKHRKSNNYPKPYYNKRTNKNNCVAEEIYIVREYSSGKRTAKKVRREYVY